MLESIQAQSVKLSTMSQIKEKREKDRRANLYEDKKKVVINHIFNLFKVIILVQQTIKDYVKENKGVLTFSYDCQKYLVLSKVSNQAAYYSRQVYLYNFTIYQAILRIFKIKIILFVMFGGK